MSKRITVIVTAVAVAGFMLFIVAVNAVGARALTATGNGVGYRSADGWWLGSYALDDGSRGFCLQAGKAWPVHHQFEIVDGRTLGWFSADDAARLAYISRTWAGTADAVTAAAGQLATWTISGLGGRTEESYAARAGADAGAVLSRAREMVDEAAREATRGVSASLTLELSETGPGRLRVEVVVDRLSSGAANVAPGLLRGTVELSGAVFPNGSSTALVENGTDLELVPTADEPTVEVAATARFTELPFGDELRVALPVDDAQALLIAAPATASASASASLRGVSPLSFQPVVETTTSHAVADPGTSVSDLLRVDVQLGDGLLPTWGVYESDGSMSSIEVTVQSRLIGPMAEPIERLPEVPRDAPVVCTVEVHVDGPGEYRTPECILVEPGYYVWVESIDPNVVDDSRGGLRVRPWQSEYGVASEITQVVAPVAVAAPVGPAGTRTLADTGAAQGALAPLISVAMLALGLPLIAAAWRRQPRRQVRSSLR